MFSSIKSGCGANIVKNWKIVFCSCLEQSLPYFLMFASKIPVYDTSWICSVQFPAFSQKRQKINIVTFTTSFSVIKILKLQVWYLWWCIWVQQICLKERNSVGRKLVGRIKKHQGYTKHLVYETSSFWLLCIQCISSSRK